MSNAKFADINPNRLRQFQLMAELGSAAKACAFLGISQPALAQNIARLEAEIGVQLFDRSTRPLRLTNNGRHLLDFVGKFQLETEALFDRLAQEQGGIIRLGCGARWMVDIIPRVIGEFGLVYPDTRFSVRVEQMDELVRLLEDRHISLLFGTTTSLRASSHLNITDFGTDRFVIVARTEHPLHKRKSVSLADLVEQRWIMGDSTASSTTVIRQALRDAGLPPILPIVEMSDTLSVANTIRNGDFIGMFTMATVRNFENIEPLTLDFELPESRSGAIHLKSYELRDSEKHLIDFVMKAFH